MFVKMKLTNEIAFKNLFQLVQIKMQGHAKSHALWGHHVPTVQAMAWSVCGAAVQRDVWILMLI
jgi:hypothetical protein